MTTTATTAVNNSSYYTLSDSISTSYSITTNVATKSEVQELKTKLDNITKKPEVPVEQRTALKVENNQVIAKIYKDGFFKNNKYLMPAIKSVEAFNKNTVKITFVNGHTQIASVQGDDPYFFEDGILRCIVKEMIGEEGTALLAKLLKYATKVYDDGIKAEEKRKTEKAAKEAARENRWKRQQRRKARKQKARIEEISDAICLGLEKFLKEKEDK